MLPDEISAILDREMTAEARKQARAITRRSRWDRKFRQMTASLLSAIRSRATGSPDLADDLNHIAPALYVVGAIAIPFVITCAACGA